MPSEIAKDFGREMGEISPLLRNLQNVDLIRKHNKRYRVIDPVLSIWLRTVYGFSEPRLAKIKSGVEKSHKELIDGVNINDEKGTVFGKPSNVEIDALCVGEENWILEFEYRDRLVTGNDLKVLKKRGKLAEEETGIPIDQICFVSVAGFREEALRFAEESDVWCIELNVLNTLLKKYGMRRIDELETCT